MEFPDAEHGGRREEVVRVIDWEEPENNDFLLASQFWVAGELYVKRPDLVGFVNGLPLVLIELKKPGVNVREVFGDYVSIYDFKQSVDDGATVPLFYENRTPELEITNPELNEEIYQTDPVKDEFLGHARDVQRLYKAVMPDPIIPKLAQVCKDLLAKLKTEKLVLAWRERRTTRAAVRVEIEKMLDSGLPEKYTTELFETKCGALFQHVLEKYPESGTNVYEAAG